MKSIVAIAIASLIGVVFAVQGQRGRDIGDPEPTVPPFPGTGKGNPIRGGEGTFPQPPVIGERHIWLELHGYAKGKATHGQEVPFSKRLAGEIRAQIAAGRRIDRIVVTGFADGIINYGIKRDIGEATASCLQNVSIPIDDHELALLRGCVILEQVSSALGQQYAGGISWRGEQYDEPDGGSEGDSYRKVKVDVYLRRK